MAETLQDSVSSNNKHHKTVLTIISELLSIPIVLLLLGMMVQIGEYKANFVNMCARVEELKKDTVEQLKGLTTAMDANAAETRQEVSKIKERVSRIEGRETRLAKQ